MVGHADHPEQDGRHPGGQIPAAEEQKDTAGDQIIPDQIEPYLQKGENRPAIVMVQRLHQRIAQQRTSHPQQAGQPVAQRARESLIFSFQYGKRTFHGGSPFYVYQIPVYVSFLFGKLSVIIATSRAKYNQKL